MLLVLTVICGSLVFATVTANASNTADSIVAIAEGELGNTNYRKYSSYANAWCADFVSWCARQAGVDSIPSTASCYSMYNGMKANGCQEVSSPQRGDIVFFFCNNCSGTSNIWCHVGIMVNSSTSIDGNYSGKVSYDNSYSHYGSLGYKHSSGISRIFVRPNYDNPNFPGEEDTSWEVPVWKTANSDLPTYNSSGGQESGHYISAGDNCCIEHVYQNGYAWVCYPIEGGGERWAYTLASGFSLDKNVPAGSQTISDGAYHIVSALDTTKGIDVATGSTDNGANIYLYSNVDDDTQVFDVTYLGNGSYKIINRKSGKGLDCDGANTASGTNVQQWEYVNEKQQQWIIQDSGDGEFFNIISMKSGLYLDVYGGESADCTNIQIYTPNNSNAQKWRFVAWGKQIGRTISDGDYHIASRLNQQMCLDVYAASEDNSANIDLYSNLSTREQVFSVTYLENGYYKIINKHSQKSLDLEGAKCVKGTNIQQYDYSDDPQKQWIIKPTDDGKAFNIVSKKGGLYIDVENGEAKDLNNIQGYISNGTEAQQWRFIPWFDNNEKTVANGEYRIVSGVDENKALDIYGAKTDNLTNLQIYSNLNDKKQTFDIEYNSDGTYSIFSHYSNKPIDVLGNMCVKGTGIVIYDDNNGDNQKWKIAPDEDGYYRIISCSCGLSLDVDGGETDDLTKVQVWTENETAAQKWKLRRVLNDSMVSVNDVTIKSETDEIIPKITVTVDDEVLPQDGNYTVEITTDLDAGKGTVTVTGIDKFCDSVTKEFSIMVEKNILGDADGNGIVEIVDATIIQRHLSNLTVPYSEETLMNADVDGDGSLTILDATFIQRYIAKIETHYPIGEPIT